MIGKSGKQTAELFCLLGVLIAGLDKRRDRCDQTEPDCGIGVQGFAGYSGSERSTSTNTWVLSGCLLLAQFCRYLDGLHLQPAAFKRIETLPPKHMKGTFR